LQPVKAIVGKREQLRRFFSQRALQSGFIALTLIVLAMLGMQLWFLFELKESSSATSRLAMRDFLINVVNDVDRSYRDAAEGLLNLRPEDVTVSAPGPFGARFRRRWTGMGKGFFVLALSTPSDPQLHLYGPTLEPLPLAPDSSEVRAINLASARWVVMRQQQRRPARPRLLVDERDEQNRLILRPILDESSLPVALAGLIVDRKFFEQQYLPTVIQRHLLRFFPNDAQQNSIVRARDETGRTMYENQSAEGRGDEVARGLSFVFTDFRLTIQSRDITPEQWAQRSFLLNLSLTVLMTIVVVGGVLAMMQGTFRAAKLSQMKTEFVSNVSHELRTPLSSLRVLGELLSAGRVRDAAKIRECGERIETESQRLTHLIDNLLDFATIESGRKLYQFERTDLAKTIPEILQAAEPGLRQGGFSLRYDGPAEGVLAMLDRDAIAEGVLNLIDNAVKYSGSAKEIVVRLEQNNGALTVSVSDHGIGLRPEETQRIFEKFYRVSNGLVHNVRGSGLGLSITKHIVEAHAGKITVESQPDRGSTFTIHLPSIHGGSHAESADCRG